MQRSLTKTVPIFVGLVLVCLTAHAQPQAFETAHKLQELGRFSEAERYYRLAIKSDPHSVAALTNLGIVLARQGRYTEATAAYKAALQVEPASAPVKLNLAIAYIQSGLCTEALPLLSAVTTKEPRNRQSRQLQAICELETGRFVQAAQSFDALLPSSDPSILLGTATAYIKAGRQSEGKLLLDRLVQEHGDMPGVQFALGLAALGAEDYSAARAAFEKTLTGDPHNADARFYLGVVEFHVNEFDSAVRNWREAVRLNRNHFQAVLALGAFLNKQGDYRSAEPLLSQAGEMRPDIAEVQIELGNLALRKGALSEARRHFTAAIDRDPDSKTASYLLATTLKRMGLQKLALAEFDRSRRLFRRDQSDLVGIALQGASPGSAKTNR